jgi:hypothetical protein
MDSKDIKELFSDWHKITMPSRLKRQVEEHLQQLFADAVFRNVTKNRRRLRIVVRVATISAVAAIVFSLTLGVKSTLDRATTVTTTNMSTPSPNANHYQTFTPPNGLVETYKISAANGSLFIAGYCDSNQLNSETTTDYWRMASKAYIVVQKQNGQHVALKELESINPQNVAIHKPLWFSAGKAWYAVTDTEVDGNQQISVYQFTQSDDSLGWSMRVVLDKTFEGFQLPYKVGDGLLIRSENIGDQVPMYYSFTESGLQSQPVSNHWPTPGTIANSTTLSLHEKVESQNGNTVVTLTGDSSPLHLNVGQTLIVKIDGDTSIPIHPLFYPDVGDPGDGSLATRLASPYTNALLFRMVAKAQHGLVVLNPDVSANVTLQGIKQVRVVVQNGVQ